MVFFNKIDVVDDQELVDLVEMEVRELLTKYEFPGDKVTVMRGSATKALEGDAKWEQSIQELMDALDKDIPEPERDGPAVLMAVEDVFSITGRGTVATGRWSAERSRWATTSRSSASRTRRSGRHGP